MVELVTHKFHERICFGKLRRSQLKDIALSEVMPFVALHTFIKLNITQRRYFFKHVSITQEFHSVWIYLTSVVYNVHHEATSRSTTNSHAQL